MPVPTLTKGLTEIMPMNKEIDADDQEEQQSARVIKLRFTRKQYEAFRNACTILEIVSSDDKFSDFVKSVLGNDVKVPTINKQLVQPIIEAPMRIPVKIIRAPKTGQPKRDSYFTNPIEATEKCIKLYSAVEDEGVNLKQNIQEGVTCVTDVRSMMSRYVSLNNLRNEHGVVVDDFIRELAPKSLIENSEYIHRVNGQYVIPKGNRKVMTNIVNEVTFG